jgi:Conserved hypothetical protein (DUF2461)
VPSLWNRGGLESVSTPEQPTEEETMDSTTFDGWPVEAPALLAEIAADNRAERWPALRERHAALVRGPTLALAAELTQEFGQVRVFRPHVTRRFRPDAPPLRVDTGGVARSPGGCAMGVVLSATALTVTVGHWRFDRNQRTRYRAAVDAVVSGVELAALVARLEGDGFPADPEGELRATPRGWRPEHPRIGLARRNGLQVVRRWELGPWVATREPLERVRAAWRAAAPLVRWLDTHVGPAADTQGAAVDAQGDPAAPAQVGPAAAAQGDPAVAVQGGPTAGAQGDPAVAAQGDPAVAAQGDPAAAAQRSPAVSR